jgi:hypothetical protein
MAADRYLAVEEANQTIPALRAWPACPPNTPLELRSVADDGQELPIDDLMTGCGRRRVRSRRMQPVCGAEGAGCSVGRPRQRHR